MLDQLIQVDTKKFKDKAEMLPVDEGVFESQKVVIVVLVELSVELKALS